MFVSVIVTTYNRHGLLTQSLQSLVNQTYAEFEVIVVDDGSSPPVADLCHHTLFGVPHCYIRQERQGYRLCRARNLGLHAAQGDVVVLFDDGIIASRYLLSSYVQQIQYFGDVLSLGYVYGYMAAPEDVLALWDEQDVDRSLDRMRQSTPVADPREVMFYRGLASGATAGAVPWLAAWSTTVALRRESALRIGLYDESLDGARDLEDIDFAYRLHDAGTVAVINREAEAIHLPHPTDMVDFTRSVREGCLKIYRRYPHWLTELYAFSVINGIPCTRYLDTVTQIRHRIARTDSDSQYEWVKPALIPDGNTAVGLTLCGITSVDSFAFIRDPRGRTPGSEPLLGLFADTAMDKHLDALIMFPSVAALFDIDDFLMGDLLRLAVSSADRCFLLLKPQATGRFLTYLNTLQSSVRLEGVSWLCSTLGVAIMSRRN